jgi:crotonobetaine/carnitine-CoA ligase
VLQILNRTPEKDTDAENPIRTFGTAHIPADLQEPFEKRFGVKLVNIYGMTEGDCTISSTIDDTRVGSCGKATANYDVRIFDPNDQELPPNEVGEIVIRPLQPYTLFEGYYKMPAKTAAAFRNLWFHTGDLAYKDDEGYIFYVGREKDMIRRGGENISAMEVEHAVESHPQVKECVAVAVPSDVWGEEVKVVIVPQDGESIDERELIAFCDARMAYFMVPRFIELITVIPRTGATHRPQKEQLKGITDSTWDRVKAGRLGLRLKESWKKHVNVNLIKMIC